MRLACRGRDAFLTPQLAAGRVDVSARARRRAGSRRSRRSPARPRRRRRSFPGSTPAEPVDPGAEARRRARRRRLSPRPGGRRRGDPARGVANHDGLSGRRGAAIRRSVYAGTTTASQIPSHRRGGGRQYGPRQLAALDGPRQYVSAASGPCRDGCLPGAAGRACVYRGPDVSGTHLQKCRRADLCDDAESQRLSDQSLCRAGHVGDDGPRLCPGVTGRLARYSAAGINRRRISRPCAPVIRAGRAAGGSRRSRRGSRRAGPGRSRS